MELAVKRWREVEGKISKTKVAKQYGLPPSTFFDRINGKTSKKESAAERQRLTPGEEKAVMDWIKRLQNWGWPTRVEQVRFLTQELCQKKGDDAPIGINYTQKFMNRHKDLKSKYIPPLDKERANAQDPVLLQGWFELFQQTKTRFQIQEEDIYNMDEKGFMMGVVAKLKVIISKYDKNKYMTQCGNREWVSLIKCVSMDGRALKPWVIFKAKLIQKAWKESLPDGYITVSENGWTNNQIGLLWLERCFEPQTATTQKGEYRMLCLDGHASHISTAAIEFAVKHKIILLCLPAHTTHILQPLDVGVFSPLATAYKNHLHRSTLLGAGYNVDKCDFLEFYEFARRQALTPDVIKSAWKKSGLLPFNPDLILSDFRPNPVSHVLGIERLSLSLRPTTPPEASISYSGSGGSGELLFTPANITQMERLMQQFKDGMMQLAAEDVLKKVGKACQFAFAESHIQDNINLKLLEVNRRKDKKNNRTRGNDGAAILYDSSVLNERRSNAQIKADIKLDKQAAIIWKDVFGKLDPDLFIAERQPYRPRRRQSQTPQKQVRFSSDTPATLSRTAPPPPPPPPLALVAPSQLLPTRRLVLTLRVRVTLEDLRQGRWRESGQSDTGAIGRTLRRRRPPRRM